MVGVTQFAFASGTNAGHTRDPSVPASKMYARCDARRNRILRSHRAPHGFARLRESWINALEKGCRRYTVLGPARAMHCSEIRLI